MGSLDEEPPKDNPWGRLLMILWLMGMSMAMGATLKSMGEDTVKCSECHKVINL